MKDKIKNILKKITDFTITEEFKLIIITLLTGLLILTFLYSWLITVMANDLVNVVNETKTENEKLTSESIRYKMLYEEVYELYTNELENSSWYENFYYENVSPYTGKLEGEYYE